VRFSRAQLAAALLLLAVVWAIIIIRLILSRA
jgi:hypothetical protein